MKRRRLQRGGTLKNLGSNVYRSDMGSYKMGNFRFIFSKDPKTDMDEFFPEFVKDTRDLFDLDKDEIKDISNNLLNRIKDISNNLLNRIKDISKRYEHLIHLQKGQFTVAYPGDIIYYNSSYKPSVYRFGHIETITGTSLVSNNTSGTELHLFRDHPNNTKSFSEESIVVDKAELEESVYCIHYIGPMASLIRATAALLTKLFIERRAINYGGICKLLYTQCKEMGQTTHDSIRMKRLHDAFDQLFSKKKIFEVCSGFTILTYQLAFYIHGNLVYLDKALPFKAEGCLPSNIYNNLSKNPLWEVKPFNKILTRGPLTASGDVSTLLSSRIKGETPIELDPFNELDKRIRFN
jgi:hypothetical protein